ncbi:MAG: hypothetical protein KF797_10450 [Flavobacteriales bacterium]|nr:hypothetical protein [Flavobacteriales bacterium]
MQNARSIRTVAFGGLLFLSTITGCRKDGPAHWDVDVAGPLLTTRLTIADLIADSLLTATPDGEVILVYSSELFAVDLDTLLGLPDTSFIYPYALPLPDGERFDLPAGFPVINQNSLVRFDLPQVELTRLDLRAGEMRIDMRNMTASRVLGDFAVPSAHFPDGSSSLSLAVDRGTPADPGFASMTRDLAWTRFDLRGPDFNRVNTLATHISAVLDPAGSGATVTNRDSVVVLVSYRDLVTNYAKGYFGTNDISFHDGHSRLALFDAVVGGTLDLDRVTLRVKVENGLGMDMQVRLNSFQAVNTRTGAVVDMQHTILQGPINLNRAVDHGNGFTPSRYENVLDNANSNVDAFVESMPDEVRYGLDIRLNPLGDISNGNDFLYYESRLKAAIDLEIPLSVIASGLTLEKVMKPDLPGDAEHPAFTQGILHLFATNDLPFDGTVALDIVGMDGAVLSPVSVQGGIRAGIMGPDGLVHTPVNSSVNARLTPEQVNLLHGEARLRARVTFDTDAQQGHVRILDRYGIDLQLTLDGTYIVNVQ